VLDRKDERIGSSKIYGNSRNTSQLNFKLMMYFRRFVRSISYIVVSNQVRFFFRKTNGFERYNQEVFSFLSSEIRNNALLSQKKKAKFFSVLLYYPLSILHLSWNMLFLQFISIVTSCVFFSFLPFLQRKHPSLKNIFFRLDGI
jgi:hypothetical protein